MYYINVASVIRRETPGKEECAFIKTASGGRRGESRDDVLGQRERGILNRSLRSYGGERRKRWQRRGRIKEHAV